MNVTRPNRRRIDDIIGWSTAAVVVLGLVFLLLPLLVTSVMAFDERSFLGPMPPPGFSLHWFVRFFSQTYFLVGLRTSLLVAIVACSISLAAGAAAALFLDRTQFWGRGVVLATFLSPLVVPPVVIGFSLLLFLAQIGVTWGLGRLVVGHVIITLPYAIRTALASLAGIDRRLEEAALNLGATEARVLWTVTLPLIRTGLISGAIFAFAVSLDDVAVSSFLTDPTTYTLPVALVSSMRATFDLTIAAASVLLIGVTVVLMFILDKAVGFDRLIGRGMFGR
ncbi:MAG TPA: ABC transporter permease [Acetobacteraceae bacterium]|jgi:putative spermidine/putrescine transport system permease protein|nr:ABC transporter permease [Acetobacteraceae bacterium]